jgi:hypothetical protein
MLIHQVSPRKPRGFDLPSPEIKDTQYSKMTMTKNIHQNQTAPITYSSHALLLYLCLPLVNVITEEGLEVDVFRANVGFQHGPLLVQGDPHTIPIQA